METQLRHHLQTCAAKYGKAKDLEPTTVGRLAAGDWRFFERIGDGASFTARKYDQILCWFADNWPDDLPWPADVPRPAPHQASAA